MCSRPQTAALGNARTFGAQNAAAKLRPLESNGRVLYDEIPDNVDDGGYGDRLYDGSLGNHARGKKLLVKSPVRNALDVTMIATMIALDH
jgi:hypothetical protein